MHLHPLVEEALSILGLLVAVAIVYSRLPRVEVGHTSAFMRRRFYNWFPLGLTYAFLYMGRYNLTAAKGALDDLGLMSNHDLAPPSLGAGYGCFPSLTARSRARRTPHDADRLAGASSLTSRWAPRLSGAFRTSRCRSRPSRAQHVLPEFGAVRSSRSTRVGTSRARISAALASSSAGLPRLRSDAPVLASFPPAFAFFPASILIFVIDLIAATPPGDAGHLDFDVPTRRAPTPVPRSACSPSRRRC